MAMNRTVLTTFVIISEFFRCFSVTGKTCSSETRSSITQCIGGHVKGSDILMDFSGLLSTQNTHCSCSIYILAGTKLNFSPIYYPGYYGCGTAIKIHFLHTSTIRCLGAAETLEVKAGDAITIEIWRESISRTDADYCYSIMSYSYQGLDMYPGAVIVACDDPSGDKTTSEWITSPVFEATSTHQTTESATNQSPTAGNLTSETGLSPTTVENTKLITTVPDGDVTVAIISRSSVHLPWDIITPVSLFIIIAIVITVVVVKVRKGNKRRLHFRPSILEAARSSGWSYTPPTRLSTAMSKRSNGHIDTGIYFALGNVNQNDEQKKESSSARSSNDVKEQSDTDRPSTCKFLSENMVGDSAGDSSRNVMAYSGSLGCDNEIFEGKEDTYSHNSKSCFVCGKCEKKINAKDTKPDKSAAGTSNEIDDNDGKITSFKTPEDCDQELKKSTIIGGLKTGDNFNSNVERQSNPDSASSTRKPQSPHTSTTTSDRVKNSSSSSEMPNGIINKRRKSYVSTAIFTVGDIGKVGNSKFSTAEISRADYVEVDNEDKEIDAPAKNELVSGDDDHSPNIDIWATL